MDQRESGSAATDSPEPIVHDIRRRAKTISQSRPGIRNWRAEYYALIQWAEENGRSLSFRYVERFKYVGEGAEHIVYHDQINGLAIKATRANRFGHSTFDEGVPATPSEYLTRLALHNLIFGDVIRIIGVAHSEERLEVVSSQPWIKGHAVRANPTDEEIEAYFREFEFEKLLLNPDAPLFYNRDLELLVADANDQNVLRGESGALSPIDIVIGEPGPLLYNRINDYIRSQAGPQ